MLKKLVFFLLLAAGLMIAAGEQTFHKDSRAGLVKLDIIGESSAKVADLDGEDLARAFLAKNAARYGIHPKLADLELVKVQESLMGFHFHFGQSLNGYKIHRAEIIVSVSNDTGNVYMVYNNTYPTRTHKVGNDGFVGVKLNDAFEIAWQDLRVHGEMIAPPTADLVYVSNEDGELNLVYLVELGVEAPFGYWEHQIDAETGEVLDARLTSISREPVDQLDFDLYEGPVWDRIETTKRFEAKERAREQAITRLSKAAANGSGTVFDPDPVTTLQNSSLSDSSSASSFTSAYFTRTLQDIDLTGGTYSLVGPWVQIINFESPNTAPSTTTSGNWTATRGNNSFNDAMTYFHIDQNQRYMQSLGFSGSTGIQYNSIGADSDGLSGSDNSHFIPSTNRIAFGHGCVDDNEDMFVILHEYGHAIHHSINSNWFGGDTGGMGEGFGDYWAGSYRYRTPNGASFNPAWAFPWDGHNSCWGGRDMDQTQFQYNPSSSYPAHATVGGVYSDELWSTPLFQALVTLTGQGVDHAEVDQIVLQAHFGLGSGLSMRDMATAIVSTATSLYPSGNHAAVFQQKFEDQNILDGGGTGPTGTEAFDGDSFSSLSGSTGSTDLYYIQVPSGATNLVVSMSGGSGDADLYLKFGSAPTTGSYDCRSWASGNTESCSVASPSAGTYYFMVHAYSSYSGLTLTVNYDGPGGSNQAPTAGFTFSTNNLTASFTNTSSDSDGTIASYSWNFGDGGGSTSANPSHSYSSAGTYSVTLTVTDNDGATDSDTQNVTVTSGGGSWTTLISTNFESGWGGFTDGGSDCQRSSADSLYAHQGTYCVRLRDDTSTSVTTSSSFSLSGYSELQVTFWYYPRSMESGEDFWVQINTGSGWQTIASYAQGSEFSNDNFYNPTVTINSGSYTFGSNTQIRFRCDASGNSDYVYIDEVVISAR